MEWARYHTNNYEVSSHGDARFSALYAEMPDGRTIEQHYQCDIKGYQPGGENWKLGKGKPPLTKLSKDDLWKAYKKLWAIWASNHPALIEDLKKKATGKVLTDKFASSPVSQARALAELIS